MGFCHLRGGLRSFRVDRVAGVKQQQRAFRRPAEFDVVAHLVHSLATLPRKFTIEVRLRTDLESARRELFEAIGVLEPQADAVLLRSQADDLDWFARELMRLPWEFEVLRPRQLQTAVARLARTLVKQHGGAR